MYRDKVTNGVFETKEDFIKYAFKNYLQYVNPKVDNKVEDVSCSLKEYIKPKELSYNKKQQKLKEKIINNIEKNGFYIGEVKSRSLLDKEEYKILHDNGVTLYKVGDKSSDLKFYMVISELSDEEIQMNLDTYHKSIAIRGDDDYHMSFSTMEDNLFKLKQLIKALKYAKEEILKTKEEIESISLETYTDNKGFLTINDIDYISYTHDYSGFDVGLMLNTTNKFNKFIYDLLNDDYKGTVFNTEIIIKDKENTKKYYKSKIKNNVKVHDVYMDKNSHNVQELFKLEVVINGKVLNYGIPVNKLISWLRYDKLTLKNNNKKGE